MKPDQFEKTIRALVYQHPFQPFLIEMTQDQNVTVSDPEHLAFAGGAASYFHEGDIFLIDSEHVLDIRPLVPGANA